jgi:cytosine/adenosine deaminase-related metal-dependent hydrolase
MLYLKNTTYIDWQTLAFQTTHIAVAPGVDGGIELLDALPSENQLNDKDNIFDCRNRLVTKSFVCGHHHIYSALARGMPPPAKVPQNFTEILEYIWWHVDRSLDKEMIEASALVTALYCVKNGVTFVIDHHASPFAIPGSLETIAKAFDRVGRAAGNRRISGIRPPGARRIARLLYSGR